MDKDIVKLKTAINDLSKVQDILFEQICSKLSVSEGDDLSDYLFDWAFNDMPLDEDLVKQNLR